MKCGMKMLGGAWKKFGSSQLQMEVPALRLLHHLGKFFTVSESVFLSTQHGCYVPDSAESSVRQYFSRVQCGIWPEEGLQNLKDPFFSSFHQRKSTYLTFQIRRIIILFDNIKGIKCIIFNTVSISNV